MTEQERRPNPYVGPRAFQTGEKLYGRDREVSEILDLLIAERILLLDSPSGAGKSSLIQAGLVPCLEAEGFAVLPPMRLNLDPPPAYQAGPGFNRYLFSALLSMEETLEEQQKIPLEQLATLNLDEYLKQRPRQEGEPGSIVLIFDQFEEILTIDPTDRDCKLAFFAQVGSALRDRTRWALFAMREDFVAALDPFLRPIPTRLSNTYRLDFLSLDAARQAIQNPAQEVGVTFTTAAVNRLVSDLSQVQIQQPDGTLQKQPGLYVEPVQLQVVCYHLWQKLPPGETEISEDEISSIGNVDQSLSEYYADRVEAAAQAVGLSQRVIRNWFDRRLITKQGFRGLVQMGTAESEGLDNRAIRILEDAHLVRSEKRLGSTWFELSHDRLIGPVRQNNAAWLQTHLSLLQRQADVWENQGRPSSLLLRGDELAEAGVWAQENPAELLPIEAEFLADSQEEEQRLREREERERREQALKLEAAQKLAEAEKRRAEEQARSAAQLRRGATLLTLALVVALALAALAGYLRNQARIAQRSANANAFAAQTAESRAVTNAGLAEAASTRAVAQSTLAFQQKSLAEAASTQAIQQKGTAEAASTQAEVQRSTAVAAQAEAEIQLVARSQGLAELARTYRTPEKLDLSLLLSIAALRVKDTVQARSALLTGLQYGLKQQTRPFRQVPSDRAKIDSVAISPDGQFLAWGNDFGEVVLWDTDKNQLVWRSKKHSGAVSELAFCGKGGALLLVSGGVDNNLIQWDLQKGSSISEKNNKNLVLGLSFNPGCTRLASAAGPQILIWEVGANGLNPLPNQPPFTNPNVINALAWSPDGKWLATGNANNTVVLWDAVQGRFMARMKHEKPVTAVAWDPESKILASAGKDGAVNLWDVSNPNTPVKLNPPTVNGDPIASLAYSGDGKLIAWGTDNGALMIWDVQNQKFFNPLSFHRAEVSGLVFGVFNGKTLLASVGQDNRIGLNEIFPIQNLSQSIGSLQMPVFSFGLSPDGTAAAGGGSQESFSTWKLGSINTMFTTTVEAPLTSAAFSPDGQTIALGEQNGAITFLDGNTGSPNGSPILAASGPVLSLAFSPDGETLAAGSCAQQVDSNGQAVCQQGEIQFWGVPDGQGLRPSIQGQGSAITALAFSPDGEILASGSQDKTIFLWDLASERPQNSALRGLSGQVTSLAFSPDGKTLAAGTADQKLVLWDPAARQPIGGPLGGATASLLSLFFDPAGQVLYSGSSDGSVLSWDVSSDSWVQRACGKAGRNMREDEWKQFFPGQAYIKICDQFPLETPAPTTTPTPTP